ncbi:MAG: polyprenyl diphosphate synthase [Candidatus Woesebacteria bacterium]|nr:polyprenyl diphosphate synthase [Candidatus Woesebacteria bacterium]
MSEEITLPKGTTVPDHIAMILDGNRRWARARGLKPWEGHYYGYQALLKVAHSVRQLGIHTFTVWAFSTENWDRSQKEIDEIMNLFKRGLKETEKDFHKEKIALVHLGRKDRLPEDLRRQIARIEAETAKYSSNHIYNLAIDYGGRDEILRATRKIVKSGISEDKVDEKLFESYLDTAGQPYPAPDLFIRTSGEQRTSGLLPWQLSYTEFYFEPEHLPDFTPEKLKAAILDFSRRRRRFGGNDAVEHLAFDPKITAKLELSWWRLKNIPEGVRIRDYAMKHLREQYGLSKKLAIEAAKYLIEAVAEEKDAKWDKATEKMKKFYGIIKNEIKLAFEPKIVASMEVDFARKMENKDSVAASSEAEGVAREHLAEVYRISLLQAAKAAHLRVMAAVERNLALAGLGEEHWAKAEDYLSKYYSALKERVA